MKKVTEINEQVVDKVIALMLQGLTLKETFKQIGISAERFFKQIFDNPVLSHRYEQAQEARAELLADELIDIADNILDSQRARNMIDARKWYASKMRPQKYGDKIDVNVNHSVDLLSAISEAKKRLRPTHDIESEVMTQGSEMIKQKVNSTTGLIPVSKNSTPDETEEMTLLLS